MRKILILLGVVTIIVVRGVQYLNSNSVDTVTLQQNSAQELTIIIDDKAYTYQGQNYSSAELVTAIQQDFPAPASLNITYSFKSSENSSKLSELSIALLKARYQIELKSQ